MDAVGFIGLGLMGRPMALNLRKAGFNVVVHSRSPGPVKTLVEAGAAAASTPREVAARATRIITMLPDSPDVEAVLTGPDGVFSAMQPGSILIDMSSIAPATARRLAAETAARGGTMLDAPVSGGEIGAVQGTLSIMVGGSADALASVTPVLCAMGNPERVIHVGEAGAGQVCKLCNQMVLAGTIAAVGEALALARKSGVNAWAVRQALLGGFAQSRVLEVHGERMLAGNYVPGFRTALFAKDLRNVSEATGHAEVPAPVTAAAQQLVQALVAQGRGDRDYSELGKLLFELAGLDEPGGT
jgi:2-hydroxy-3-oxopropionate reductase